MTLFDLSDPRNDQRAYDFREEWLRVQNSTPRYFSEILRADNPQQSGQQEMLPSSKLKHNVSDKSLVHHSGLISSNPII